MALNWIVPARRLVIASERASYEDVLVAWLDQLRTHRDTLLDWYSPLTENRELGRDFDRALDMLAQWKDWFLAGSPSEAGHAVATGGSQTLDQLDFRARLWKGPLRVLKEAELPPPPPPTDPPPRRRPPPPDPPPPELTEIDVDGPLPLLLDGVQRVVLNHDATLLPGDVLELPIFRIWWLAGITRFAGLRFRRDAAPFFGDTVGDAEGVDQDTITLHDNLLAMRFQALLGAAVGGYPSFTSGWVEGSRNAQRAHSHRVEGHTIHARGFIYGGALGDTAAGGPHKFKDMHWGSLHVPTRATLGHFAAGTRLTTAWACSPCALGLAAYLTDQRDSWDGGGIGPNSRRADGNYVAANSELDFFGVTMPGGDDRVAAIWTEAGLPGDASLEGLRSLAFGRMFGNPASLERRPEAFDHAARLPAATYVAITAAQVLDYLEGAAWAGLSLNGHEYSWVPVHAHDDLLAEPVFESAAGRVPPRIGPIAAYDPIDGTPYVASGSGPDLYVFEATGSFHPTPLHDAPRTHPRAGEAHNFTVFEVRPFRWTKFEQIELRRETRTTGRGDTRRVVDDRIEIGEGVAACGERTRGKELLSIARFSLAEIRSIHARAHAFPGLRLLDAAPVEARVARDRAVGTLTLAESSADATFLDLDRAEQTRVANLGVITAALATLQRCKRSAASLSADDRAWLELRTPGLIRRAERNATRLRSESLAARDTRRRQIATLRTRLAGRYPVEGSEAAELPVERRAAFLRVVAHAGTERRTRDERSLRDLSAEEERTPDLDARTEADWQVESLRQELQGVIDDAESIRHHLSDPGD